MRASARKNRSFRGGFFIADGVINLRICYEPLSQSKKFFLFSFRLIALALLLVVISLFNSPYSVHKILLDFGVHRFGFGCFVE